MAHSQMTIIMCEMDLGTPGSCFESLVIALAGLLLETRLLEIPDWTPLRKELHWLSLFLGQTMSLHDSMQYLAQCLPLSSSWPPDPSACRPYALVSNPSKKLDRVLGTHQKR